jgi:AbrB family looped-hinge helix DNA binding protein
MRLTSKGQVTIPQDIREKAGLMPGSEVEFHFEDGRVWLARNEDHAELRRNRIRAAIKTISGSANANIDLSTDDIMALTRGED